MTLNSSEAGVGVLRHCQIKRSYRSDRDEIATAFYRPMLRASTSYDRASGYFTSGMLLFLLPALAEFVSDGRIRLVVSPDLSIDDETAIAKGYLKREDAAFRSAELAIEDFLAKSSRDSRDLLALLVQSRALDIRIASTRTRGIFHEKIGIFRDSVDAVAFTGSLNETAAAFASNFESIDVFTSWDDPQRVLDKGADFEALWENRTPTIRVVEFPAHLRTRLIDAAKTGGMDEAETSLQTRARVLRDYQQQAIDSWSDAGHSGILNMATGSGKTLTALFAARSALASGARTITILAPLKHLAEQWAVEVQETLNVIPIICHSDHDWQPQVKSAAILSTNSGTPTILISTYMTAESDSFRELTRRLPKAHMLIADEVHNVTLASSESVLRDDYEFRLGLSATPERFEDDKGTEATSRYFGGTVFNYSLGQAISSGSLTPYRYEPIFCSLTTKEQLEYERLLSELQKTDHESVATAVKSALQSQRLSLLQNAYDKLVQFEQLLGDRPDIYEGYSLVYCHPSLVDVVLRFIGTELRVSAHTFTARESLAERREILSRFASGELKVLVAIRCLDEGVDVPAVRTAFLLNSSSNPKEFVQRRGRVLRLSHGKLRATIYDFVVLPNRVAATHDQLLEKEMHRFDEFASLAINRHEATLALERRMADLGLILPLRSRSI